MTRKKCLFLIPFFILSLDAFSNNCEKIIKASNIHIKDEIVKIDSAGELVVNTSDNKLKNYNKDTNPQIVTYITPHTYYDWGSQDPNNKLGDYTVSLKQDGSKRVIKGSVSEQEILDHKAFVKNKIEEIKKEYPSKKDLKYDGKHQLSSEVKFELLNGECIVETMTTEFYDYLLEKKFSLVEYDHKFCEKMDQFKTLSLFDAYRQPEVKNKEIEDFLNGKSDANTDLHKFLEFFLTHRKDLFQKNLVYRPEAIEGNSEPGNYRDEIEINKYRCNKFTRPKNNQSLPSSPNTGTATKN